jgi:hypothetical protein
MEREGERKRKKEIIKKNGKSARKEKKEGEIKKNC